jgi:hypothetical protein
MAANNGNVVAIGGNGTPTVHSSLQGQRAETDPLLRAPNSWLRAGLLPLRASAPDPCYENLAAPRCCPGRRVSGRIAIESLLDRRIGNVHNLIVHYDVYIL